MTRRHRGTLEPWRALQAGDRVIATGGPGQMVDKEFYGAIGTILEITEEGYARVQLDTSVRGQSIVLLHPEGLERFE